MIDLGDRTILWLGEPSWLARVHRGVFGTRVGSIVRCPSAGDGRWDDLVGWLASHVAPGTRVDVVFAQHLLRVEAFPPLGGELPSAVESRLKRELIAPLDTIRSILTRADGNGWTVGVFAGCLTATSLGTTRALHAARLKAGRLGFAGQLAVQTLTRQKAGPGSWAVIPDVALAPRLLLYVPASGQPGLVAADSDEAAQAKLRLLLGRQAPAAAPIDLAVAARGTYGRLSGPALPPALAATLPAFLAEPSCRLASTEEVEYPYHFAPSSWAFTAIVLLMAAYGWWLHDKCRDQMTTVPMIRLLSDRLADAKARQKALEGQMADLAYVEANVRGLSVELYDNMSWLVAIGAIRDRSAPGLLFDVVTYESAVLSLTGRHPTIDPILAFHKALSLAFGEEVARLDSVSRDSDGSHRFSFTIERRESHPSSRDERAAL